MIDSGILRDTENASSTRKIHKPATLEKCSLKAKALGDVRNTLHSRQASFLNKNTPGNIPGKFSSLSKSTTARSVLSTKKATEKTLNNTPIKSESKSLLLTPDVDDYGLLQFHNHGMCEQGDSFISSYFSAYKLSEEEIDNLVYGVKNFQRPVSVRVWEPCQDIELPEFKGKAEESFSFNDILSDIILPEIPPP